MTAKAFGIIGGDMRQIYMAEALVKDGHKVLICGFEKADLHSHNLSNDILSKVISESKYIILPVPITHDGKMVSAPFANKEIKINTDLEKMLKNKKVFGGIISQFEKVIKTDSLDCLKDYYSREDFMVQNAVPSAEGAVKVAMEISEKVINKSRCLVVGYGRIGKVLSKLLKNMGANVNVSARCPRDLAWIDAMGYTSANINTSDDALDYDLIFNTVPYLIFDEKMLLRCAKNTIIIDLASAPGGVDFKFAEKTGITAVQALALPGKFFPKTAGEIIKKTIYAIIKEENL